jgi:hypothetical protein
MSAMMKNELVEALLAQGFNTADGEDYRDPLGRKVVIPSRPACRTACVYWKYRGSLSVASVEGIAYGDVLPVLAIAINGGRLLVPCAGEVDREVLQDIELLSPEARDEARRMVDAAIERGNASIAFLTGGSAAVSADPGVALLVADLNAAVEHLRQVERALLDGAAPPGSAS